MTEIKPQDIAKKGLVYDVPEAERVLVDRDLEFAGADGRMLALDLYLPPDSDRRSPLPVVVLVAGYRDEGTQSRLGCRFKEMQSNVSWARLIAASGMAAVTFTNRSPADDFVALLVHVRDHATTLGIDGSRIGLWASSGNVPVALSALMRDAAVQVKCAALLYGLTLDLDGATHVANHAKTFGFPTPVAGKTVDDFATEVPIFLARAGLDQFAGLNDTMDRFVTKALAANMPLTLVNHATGPHAFDLFDDSGTSREIVRRVLGFLSFELGGGR